VEGWARALSAGGWLPTVCAEAGARSKAAQMKSIILLAIPTIITNYSLDAEGNFGK
jgi:hypothetical protein